ncbi:MAG: hypothetical protein RI953_1068 [Pseudomonadota bacterium]|jgi:hypothetical protein
MDLNFLRKYQDVDKRIWGEFPSQAKSVKSAVAAPRRVQRM